MSQVKKLIIFTRLQRAVTYPCSFFFIFFFYFTLPKHLAQSVTALQLQNYDTVFFGNILTWLYKFFQWKQNVCYVGWKSELPSKRVQWSVSGVRAADCIDIDLH